MDVVEHSHHLTEDEDEISADMSEHNKNGTMAAPTAGTNTGRWSNEEHSRFLKGLESFG